MYKSFDLTKSISDKANAGSPGNAGAHHALSQRLRLQFQAL